MEKHPCDTYELLPVWSTLFYLGIQPSVERQECAALDQEVQSM